MNRNTALRLASTLTLTALTSGMLPATLNTAGTGADAEQTQLSSATNTSWSLVGTVDPQHVYIPNKTQLVMYGVQAFNSTYAGFDPRVIPPAVLQVVVPYVRIPDGNSHTYKLVFHLFTAGTTTTRYQLDTRLPVAVAAGSVTLEFTQTTAPTDGPSWYAWSLGNVNNDIWHFYSCDLYEQAS